MSMVYRASRLAMAAAKAQQTSSTTTAPVKTAAVAAAVEGTTKVSKRGGGGGLTKPVTVSPEMKKFLGVSEVVRSEALKKIWDHIKTNNLQDPANKKVIVCDEKLKSIFGQKENVNFLEIAKLMSPHFIKK